MSEPVAMPERTVRCETVEPWMANEIWQVLVETCGCRNDDNRFDLYSFCSYLERNPHSFGHEYRFMGALGFGGKFYNDNFRWRVGCYREHETPARVEMMRIANERLAELRLIYTEATDA